MAYRLPKVELEQQFAAVPVFTDNPLAACIVGPRYAVQAEVSNGTDAAEKYTAGAPLAITLIHSDITTANTTVALKNAYANYFPLSAFYSVPLADTKFKNFAGTTSLLKWDADANLVDMGVGASRSVYLPADVAVGDMLRIGTDESVITDISTSATSGSFVEQWGTMFPLTSLPTDFWKTASNSGGGGVTTTNTTHAFWPYLYGGRAAGAGIAGASVLDKPFCISFKDSSNVETQGYGCFSIGAQSLVVMDDFDAHASTDIWTLGSSVGSGSSAAAALDSVLTGTIVGTGNTCYLYLGDPVTTGITGKFLRPACMSIGAAAIDGLLTAMTNITTASTAGDASLLNIVVNLGAGSASCSWLDNTYLRPPADCIECAYDSDITALKALGGQEVYTYFVWKVGASPTTIKTARGPKVRICRDAAFATATGRLGLGWNLTLAYTYNTYFNWRVDGTWLQGVTRCQADTSIWTDLSIGLYRENPNFSRIVAYPRHAPTVYFQSDETTSPTYGGYEGRTLLQLLPKDSAVNSTTYSSTFETQVDVSQVIQLATTNTLGYFPASTAAGEALLTFFNSLASFYLNPGDKTASYSITSAGVVAAAGSVTLPYATAAAYVGSSGISVLGPAYPTYNPDNFVDLKMVFPEAKFKYKVTPSSVRYNVVTISPVRTIPSSTAVTLYRPFSRKVLTSGYSVNGNLLTINSGLAVTDVLFSNGSLSLPLFNNSNVNYKAEVLYSYKRFDNTGANTLYSITGTFDAAIIESALGLIESRNPLALGVWVAKYNAGTAPVYYMPIATDDEAGYTAALAALTRTKKPYSLVPLTQNADVLDLFKEHVATMSSATEGAWRRAYVSADVQSNGTTAQKLEAIVAAVAAAGDMSANDDRGELIGVTVGPFVVRDESVSGYYGGCAAAGARSSVVPHQPLTNAGLNGIDSVAWSYNTFNASQLNDIAEQGAYLIVQDDASDTPYVRHQITANYSETDVNRREESVVTNAHHLNYSMKASMEPYIGRYNAYSGAIDMAKASLTAVLDYHKGPAVSTVTAGPQILSYEITRFEKNALLKDALNVTVQTTLPGPINNIDMLHEVQ